MIFFTFKPPRLTDNDSTTIWTFLRKYDKYKHEATSRARQLNGAADAEAALPVNIKYCVDVDFLESSIDLGFIPNATSYDTITDVEVRAFLDGRVNQKKVVTFSKLDKIVEDEFEQNIKKTNATARMQDLFSQ